MMDDFRDALKGFNAMKDVARQFHELRAQMPLDIAKSLDGGVRDALRSLDGSEIARMVRQDQQAFRRLADEMREQDAALRKLADIVKPSLELQAQLNEVVTDWRLASRQAAEIALGASRFLADIDKEFKEAARAMTSVAHDISRASSVAVDAVTAFGSFTRQPGWAEVLASIARNADSFDVAPNSSGASAAVVPHEDFYSVLKALTGAKFPLNTRQRRIVFIVIVLYWVFSNLWSCYTTAADERQHERQRQADIADRQTAERELERKFAAQLAEVASAIQALRSENAVRDRVMLVTTRTSLRAEQKGSSHRLQPIKPGQRVRVHMIDDRWFWVELLTPDGEGTGKLGWTYRSVLRAVDDVMSNSTGRCATR